MNSPPKQPISFVERLREKQRRRESRRTSAGTSTPTPTPNESTEQAPTTAPPNTTPPTPPASQSKWIDWNDPQPKQTTTPSSATDTTELHQKQSTSKSILKNDYLENFVVTGNRPQNYVRDSNPVTRFIEYPKLDTLFRLKRTIVQQFATPPRYLKADLWNFDLKNLGSQFDVILVDPPLMEYAARSTATYDREFKKPPPGCPADLKLLWSWDDVASMNIPDIAAPRSFIFIWIGDGEGLERGRDLLAKWGYRRAEDIVWAKTNKTWTGSYQAGPFPCLQRQKEHCLVGIRGTLRRSSDTHFIHCNVDTDIIISEEPPNGDTAKPTELYTIIENFCLGRRRLELFGRDSNVRNGWLTVGAELSASNFNPHEYVQCFRKGAVVPFDQEIESLRPKSPPPRNKRF